MKDASTSEKVEAAIWAAQIWEGHACPLWNSWAYEYRSSPQDDVLITASSAEKAAEDAVAAGLAMSATAARAAEAASLAKALACAAGVEGEKAEAEEWENAERLADEVLRRSFEQESAYVEYALRLTSALLGALKLSCPTWSAWANRWLAKAEGDVLSRSPYEPKYAQNAAAHQCAEYDEEDEDDAIEFRAFSAAVYAARAAEALAWSSSPTYAGQNRVQFETLRCVCSAFAAARYADLDSFPDLNHEIRETIKVRTQ